MKNINDYIASGIIEMYVLGLSSEEENSEVEQLSLIYPEIKDEIEAVSRALLLYKQATLTVSPKVKPLLMATIDYTERLKNGETPVQVPLLNEDSTAGDYATWLERTDMVRPDDAEDAYAKIIGYGPEAMTAIVWMQNEMPHETHTNEHERFLVLEGSCDIVMDDRTVSLAAGNYFSIPLHMGHLVKITSKIPCKVILQRAAA